MAALDGSLEGRVALVTGGGSGIGAAVSRRLAAEGARVVVADIVGSAAESVAEEIGGRGVALDVGSAAAWPAAISGILATEGGLDLVHLNAGVSTGEADPTLLTEEQYRRVMGANLDGVVYGTRAAAGAMKASGGGAIVATASLAGIIAFAPDPVYTLTKHAVVGFVRSSAMALSAYGISINCLCPAVVDTPLLGEGRDRLVEMGLPLIPPSAIADALVSVVQGGGTGEAWTCVPHRDPEPWTFASPDIWAPAPPAAS